MKFKNCLFKKFTSIALSLLLITGSTAQITLAYNDTTTSNTVYSDSSNNENSTQSITSINALEQLFKNGGNGKLSADITANDYLSISAANVKLDLNGYLLNLNGKNIVVQANNSFIVTDSEQNLNSKIGFWLDDNYIVTRVNQDSSTELNKGMIYGGQGYDVEGEMCGGAIYNLGTFTLENGIIAGNKALYGGGIGNESTITIKGGMVTDNKALHSGGGIDNYNGKTIITSGNIFNNTAEYRGGGIYNGGDFTMTGGSVYLNKAAFYGSGIYVFNERNITLGGTARIQSNTPLNGDELDCDNLYLSSGFNKITISKDIKPDNMIVNVSAEHKPTKENPINITSENSDDYSSYFISDDSSSFIIQNSDKNEIQLAVINSDLHTINATANEGGSITPSGSISVNKGESKTFNINVNYGYKIYDVKINGKSIEPVTSYTFTNIQSDNTINVTFVKADVKTGWEQDSNGKWKYYLNGEYVTGWQKDIKGYNGQWFYFNESDGIMKTGWADDIPDRPLSWTYFDLNTGAMKVGWADDIPGYEGQWFYFHQSSRNSKGIMRIGWVTGVSGYDSSYFYFDLDTGIMQKGWKNDIAEFEGKWFYFDLNTGVAAKGLKSDIPGYNGYTFCFDTESSAMQTGWQYNISEYKNKWLYFDLSTGIMKTGWANYIPGYEGKWFYFNNNGTMQTGRKVIEGIEYYFRNNGILIDANTGSKIDDVNLLLQYPTLPTGCEVTSLTMLLNYIGCDISKESLARDYLPQSSDFYYKDGKMYGPDFTEIFAGNPFSEYSYGCYNKPIEKTIENYFKVNNITDKEILNLTGCEVTELYKQINLGSPVVVWGTMYMLPTFKTEIWTTPEGKTLQWKANEHCLLLTGYDKDKVFFNDPLLGKVSFPRNMFEQRFKELGNQAITVK